MTASTSNPGLPPAGNSVLGTTARIVGSKVLSGISSAGVIIVTARQLGPEGRGVFVLVFTLATFSMVVCGLGINISGRLQLVTAHNPVSSREYFGLGSALGVTQGAVSGALAAVLLPVLDVYLSWSEVGLVAALAVTLFANYIAIDALNAYGHTVAAAAVDALGSAAQLLLVVGVAVADRTALAPFLLALISAYALQAVFGFAYLRRVGIDIRPRYGVTEWIRLLRHGPSGMAIQLGQHSIFKLDRYLIALFLSPGAVGVYSVAAAFPEMLRLLPVAMAQPVLYGLASGTATRVDFARSRRAGLMLMVAGAAITAAVAPWAVPVLFGPDYKSAITPLRLLLGAEVALAVYYIDGAALTGQRRVRETASAVLIGLVVAIAGYLALIPWLGINGAAMASVIAYASMATVVRVRIRRQPGALPPTSRTVVGNVD